MAWVKVDDGAPEHMKVRSSGTDAYALWNAALAYSNRHLLDGRIPKDRLSDIWRPVGERFPYAKSAARLIETGLWHADNVQCSSKLCPAHPENRERLDSIPGAYVVHDYFDYQKSKVEVLEERAKSSLRQQKYRGRRFVKPARGDTSDDGYDVPVSHESNVSGNASRNGVTHTVSNGPPDPAPDPVRSILRDPVLASEAVDGSTAVIVARAGLNGNGLNLEAFQGAVANAGIRIELGRTDRERFSELFPVEPYELEHAIARAKEKGATKPAYVLSVIEGERKRAAELALQPKPPPAAAPHEKPLDTNRWEGLGFVASK